MHMHVLRQEGFQATMHKYVRMYSETNTPELLIKKQRL